MSLTAPADGARPVSSMANERERPSRRSARLPVGQPEPVSGRATRRAPCLAEALAERLIHRGASASSHFLEKASPTAGDCGNWRAIRKLAAGCTVDHLRAQPYFADQLLRHPELLRGNRRACRSTAGAHGSPRRRCARRCAASSAGRCCASSARASAMPACQSSRRWNDLRSWPTP